jgi:hypothetical protein
VRITGRRINRTQVAKYMEHRKELEQEAAAAKAGNSVPSARRIELAGGLPAKQETRSWRTCSDPLSQWGESDIAPLVTATPALNAVTILEELQRRYSDAVSPALLRTLQRRLRQWRAVHGGEREVYFAQERPPGRLGLSDFADFAALGVLVEGSGSCASALPVRAGVLGLAPRRGGTRRREVRGAGRAGCRTPCGNSAASPKSIGQSVAGCTAALASAFRADL